MFAWWGVAGQLPMNFAISGAVLLGTAIAFVWLSRCSIRTAVGWFVGLMLGMILGDYCLGIPWNGPVPPNLEYERMLGPVIGSSFGASMVITFWYAHLYVYGATQNCDSI